MIYLTVEDVLAIHAEAVGCEEADTEVGSRITSIRTCPSRRGPRPWSGVNDPTATDVWKARAPSPCYRAGPRG